MSCNNCSNTPAQNMQNRMNYRGYQNGFQQGSYRNTRQSNYMQNRNRQNSNMNNQQPNCDCAPDNAKDNENLCDRKDTKESCRIETMPVDKMNPGMAYVPWQEWEGIIELDEAIECGTIFKDLVKPYVGRSR